MGRSVIEESTRNMMRIELAKLRGPLNTLRELSRSLPDRGRDANLRTSIGVVLLRVAIMQDELNGSDPTSAAYFLDELPTHAT